MSDLGNWRPASTTPQLTDDAVHVWRIAIDHEAPLGPYWTLLAPDEQARAGCFAHPAHQAAYVFAHGAMRTILAGYQNVAPGELRFEPAASGKPGLLHSENGRRLEFNLSHSGNLALLAVTRNRAVGVDIERWTADVDHARVAERSFSSAERDALRSLVGTPGHVVEGFYAAWCRKEAYLKATGRGVSQGLDDFDVSLGPGEPAVLIADRRDSDATSRWTMVALPAGAGYSAALVMATPVGDVDLFEWRAPASRQVTHASAKPASTSAM